MVRGRLLFQTVQRWPGGQATKEQEGWDYPQMGKEPLQECLGGREKGFFGQGLLFLPQVGLGSWTAGLYEIIC